MIAAVAAAPPLESLFQDRIALAGVDRREEQAVAEAGEAAQSPAEAPAAAEPAADAAGLSPEEQRVVAELQRSDREVRAHENAHIAAAGGYARGASFSFTTGPDGRQYAVGGEVSIDSSPVDGDPQATIQKAQQIRSAANAPANPSGQDRQVAAAASQMEAAARIELAQEKRQELEEQQRGAQAGAFEQQAEPAADAGARTERILNLLA